jgi:hypothetical protein
VFTDVIFTLEPEHVKRVLATDFDNFEKGEHYVCCAFEYELMHLR